MLDYKDIITKHCALGMTGSAIAETLGVSKSGVNDFLRAFKACKDLKYPLPKGITNYGIAAVVYPRKPTTHVGRDVSYELPDYEAVSKDMSSRKNMTLKVLWNRYVKKCRDSGLKFYSYRQFCENYAKWCEENKETLHFNAVIGQKMEVDFAGKTFQMVDPLTGEVVEIVVFVAVLPYSQYIYAEGMVSTKEPQWIAVNNNALAYFGGVPALVICDNCKQAVIANRDWIAPELNKDYAEWAEHNHTVILPAKVKKPKYKSSVENAVGILEKGFFHDMEEMDYFSLEQFNRDLWKHLDKLNSAPFTKKPHSRRYYWDEERRELMPLPPVPYGAQDGQGFLGLPCSLRQRLLQRRPSLSAQRSPHPGICCHGEDFLQRRGIYLRMAQSHRQESVVYGSKSSPGQLQGTFRVERDLFHPEGHDHWPQHRSGD